MNPPAAKISVIMATWGRRRHILPSIRSVLAQDMPAFELIVVGDACADDTEAVIAGVGDPRVRWMNLDMRVGSQSGPNNAGIAAAQAEIIAYLGHDDIWEPDHLRRILALYDNGATDFAVSGAVYHLPNGLPAHQVTGIFPDGTDVRRYFFPPSSFSHLKSVIDRIGPWRLPMDLKAPVDEDFLLRAGEAGLRFRSTGLVTVHKFAAGHRYLSYVAPESREQAEMLANLSDAGHKAKIAAMVETVRAEGLYMVGWDRNFDRFQVGELARENRRVKGLNLGKCVPLGFGLTILHPEEGALFDWEDRLAHGFRQTKANPRPKLLLPVTGGPARLKFTVRHAQRAALQALAMLVNGEPVATRRGWAWRRRGAYEVTFRATILLREDGPSVLELVLAEAQRPRKCVPGISVGPLRLTRSWQDKP